MKLSVRKADVTKAAPVIHARKGGVTKAGQAAWVRTGGALKQFYGKLAVALSTDSALGRANSAALIKVTSEPVTATATGTIGAVTYAWTRTDADPQVWTIDDPAEATTTFSTDCDQGQAFEATFVCTVTDSAGQVLASDTLSVSCANIFYGGGYKGSAPPAPGSYYP